MGISQLKGTVTASAEVRASLHHIQLWVVLPWARRCAPLLLFRSFQQVISPSKLCCFCIQRLSRQVFLAWPLGASHPLFSINLLFFYKALVTYVTSERFTGQPLSRKIHLFGVTKMQQILRIIFTSYNDPLQGLSAPDVIILPRPGDIQVEMVLHSVARTASKHGSSW